MFNFVIIYQSSKFHDAVLLKKNGLPFRLLNYTAIAYAKTEALVLIPKPEVKGLVGRN
jgi:hypothetical protein